MWSRFTGVSSFGCSFHRTRRSLECGLSRMRFLLQKPAVQNVLDAVDLHRHVRAGEPGDLGNCGGVHFLEIADHDLAIERLELADQAGETELDALPVYIGRFITSGGRTLDLFEDGEPGVG